MKTSFILRILLLVFIVSTTIYSQSLVDKIKKDNDIAYDYFMGEKKDYKKATAYYEKVVKAMQELSADEILENKFDGAYLNLAALYRVNGNYKGALKCQITSFKLTNFKFLERDLIIYNTIAKNEEENWKAVGNYEPFMSADGDLYLYNTKKVKRNNGRIQVWLKIIKTGLTAPSNRELLDDLSKESNKDINELLQVEFPYSIVLDEYDCNQQKSRLLKCIEYSDDGSVIDNWDNDNPKWSEMAPGSLGEGLIEFFCK